MSLSKLELIDTKLNSVVDEILMVIESNQGQSEWTCYKRKKIAIPYKEFSGIYTFDLMSKLDDTRCKIECIDSRLSVMITLCPWDDRVIITFSFIMRYESTD